MLGCGAGWCRRSRTPTDVAPHAACPHLKTVAPMPFPTVRFEVRDDAVTARWDGPLVAACSDSSSDRSIGRFVRRRPVDHAPASCAASRSA